MFHAETKRAIWKAKVGPGASVCIHTVTLDDPLLLKITLRYCKSVEGIVLNRPRDKVAESAKLADRMNNAFEVNI